MKIELVDRNAETLEEAYGLSEKEMEELVNKLHNIDLKKFINKREYVIPFIIHIDPKVEHCVADIIGTLEEKEIENTVDLIETICNVDKKLGAKYLLLFFKINNYKDYLLYIKSKRQTK